MAPQPLEKLGWGLSLSVLSSVFNGVLAMLLFKRCPYSPLHRARGRCTPSA
jgi:hypothetical protein